LGYALVLPHGAFIPAIVVFFIALLLISIFGNIGIDLKTKKFNFGFSKQRKNERSCTDCILLLLVKRTEFEALYNTKKSNILRDQMTYVEHKMQELQFVLEQSFREDIQNLKKEENPNKENKEFILYHELISNALFVAKDEVRRSFKENGFHNMNDMEFSIYLKDRANTLNTIVKEYLSRNYPISGMIVPIDERLKRSQVRHGILIENLIRDVYSNAKDIRTKIENELELLQKKFSEQINEFIKGVK